MKLVFRKIKEEDLEMILKWRTMPEVSTYMYTDFEPDMEKQRQWFKRINNDPARMDWIITVDDEDVGEVSL
ncbi:MAG: GNAT family N-acetyltransferase, partial [Candidatus Zixiibacteriota bacterium]